MEYFVINAATFTWHSRWSKLSYVDIIYKVSKYLFSIYNQFIIGYYTIIIKKLIYHTLTTEPRVLIERFRKVTSLKLKLGSNACLKILL